MSEHNPNQSLAIETEDVTAQTAPNEDDPGCFLYLTYGTLALFAIFLISATDTILHAKKEDLWIVVPFFTIGILVLVGVTYLFWRKYHQALKHTVEHHLRQLANRTTAEEKQKYIEENQRIFFSRQCRESIHASLEKNRDDPELQEVIRRDQALIGDYKKSGFIHLITEHHAETGASINAQEPAQPFPPAVDALIDQVTLHRFLFSNTLMLLIPFTILPLGAYQVYAALSGTFAKDCWLLLGADIFCLFILLISILFELNSHPILAARQKRRYQGIFGLNTPIKTYLDLALFLFRLVEETDWKKRLEMVETVQLYLVDEAGLFFKVWMRASKKDRRLHNEVAECYGFFIRCRELSDPQLALEERLKIGSYQNFKKVAPISGREFKPARPNISWKERQSTFSSRLLSLLLNERTIPVIRDSFYPLAMIFITIAVPWFISNTLDRLVAQNLLGIERATLTEQSADRYFIERFGRTGSESVAEIIRILVKNSYGIINGDVPNMLHYEQFTSYSLLLSLYFLVIWLPTLSLAIFIIPFVILLFTTLCSGILYLIEHWAPVSRKNIIASFFATFTGSLLLTYPRPTIGIYEKAALAFPLERFPRQWLYIQLELGNLYLKRAINYINAWESDHLTQDISNFFDLAEQCYRYVLDEPGLILSDDLQALLSFNLGQLYFYNINGNRNENLEKALSTLRKASRYRSVWAQPTFRIRVELLLGRTLLDRIEGDPRKNIEQAFSHFDLARSICPIPKASPYLFGFIEHQLGLAHQITAREDDPGNIEASIHHLRNALTMVRYLKSIVNSLYYPFWRLFPPPWYVDYKSQPWLDEAAIRLDLGNAYATAKDLHNAPTQYEGAARIKFGRENEEVVNDPNNSWLKIEFVIPSKDKPEDQSDRFHLLSPFQRTELLGDPRLGIVAIQKKADFYAELLLWDKAIEDYTFVLSGLEKLLKSSKTLAGRLYITARMAHCYRNLAYCALRTGKYSQALLWQELSRARVLGQTSRRGKRGNKKNWPDPAEKAEVENKEGGSKLVETLKTSLPKPQPVPNSGIGQEVGVALTQPLSTHPQNQPLTPEEMTESDILLVAPPGGALVIPMITTFGSMIWVIPAGTREVSEVNILYLPRVTEKDVLGVLFGKKMTAEFLKRGSYTIPKTRDMGGWIGTYMQSQQSRSREGQEMLQSGMDGYLQMVWTMFTGPVMEKLRELKVREGAPVTILPQGILSVLPFHASYQLTEKGRDYFLDHYQVAYLPSAYSGCPSSNSTADPEIHHRVFMVANPTGDLKFAETEVESVAQFFEGGAVAQLSRDEAVKNRVIAEMGSAGYLHFACHGFHHWSEPLRSGIVLGQGSVLTTLELLEQRMVQHARLVVLSACETGLVDLSRSPDELIGLPIGFLNAGASGVISTLWAVNDQATSLLIEAFYRNHLERGMEPAAALRQAQTWLRSATRKELGEYYSSLLRMSTDAAYFGLEEMVLKGQPEDRPYAHPYYWAAFTYLGN